MKLKDLIPEDKGPCWKGYEQIGMKNKGGKQVPNCVPISEEYDVVNYEDYQSFVPWLKELNEAEYQGRDVKLGKPMQGDVKKFKVYVKNPKGNVVKVNFGQKGMNIKKDNPGPRHKARYWSCKKW